MDAYAAWTMAGSNDVGKCLLRQIDKPLTRKLGHVFTDTNGHKFIEEFIGPPPPGGWKEDHVHIDTDQMKPLFVPLTQQFRWRHLGQDRDKYKPMAMPVYPYDQRFDVYKAEKGTWTKPESEEKKKKFRLFDHAPIPEHHKTANALVAFVREYKSDTFDGAAANMTDTEVEAVVSGLIASVLNHVDDGLLLQNLLWGVRNP